MVGLNLSGKACSLKDAVFQYSITPLLYYLDRGVAQPGSALAWGVRCRRFKSSRPDHLLLQRGWMNDR